MFMGERTEKFQQAILAGDDDTFQNILDNVLRPLQRSDLEEIFTVMTGLPVIIRLLPPPP